MKLVCKKCGRKVDRIWNPFAICSGCGGNFQLDKNNILKNISKSVKPTKILQLFLTFFIVIMGIVALFDTFYIVETGQRAVLLTFGNANSFAKAEGLHIKIPFVQKAISMNVRTQKYEADASAASNDLQTVSTKIAVNFHLSPENVPDIYKNVGVNYGDNVISPTVQEVVKASTAKYTAEQLITKRAEVKEDIKLSLSERLSKRSIIVEDISITNFDFSESFNSAVESKVTAEQNALQARNKLEQIRYEAEQKVVSAEAEAKALALQKAQITPDLLELRKIEVQRLAIEKWNGVMPTTLLQGENGLIPTIPITN